jgi:molybdopterin-guanine dinucleotide biosynthesis protein A
LHKSAIILAGGFSSRFGQDKGLLRLANKPLIRHALDMINSIVDEKVVVARSKTQAEKYAKAISSDTKIVADPENVHGPLVGALTGFKESKEKYALLLPCDTPLVSKDVISLLFDLCWDKTAVIPRWPNCYIEPLHAVYCVDPALKATKRALSKGKLNLQSMVNELRGIRHVSTLVLEQLDPGLGSFFNVNTPSDLKKAELMLLHRQDIQVHRNH